MSFAQDNGYTPVPLTTLISAVREQINTEFGTDYTEESFVGTNWYKFVYALLQRVQQNEIKTSEIFQKLQEYIQITNEKIQRPSVSFPGLIDSFDSQGFVASVKPPADADAGKIFICADLDDAADDYAESKLQFCTLLKDFVAAGMVSQGTEVETITLSNGQSFNFKFNLPNRIPVLLRITLDVSENNLSTIPDDVDIRQVVFDNINSMYRLGWNFEPERYYTIRDASWAGNILLEWSDDAGANYYSTVYDAAYVDLFTFGLEDITVVVNT
jgi:hypothetical protein